MTLRDTRYPDIVITEDCPMEWLQEIKATTRIIQCGGCGETVTFEKEVFVIGDCATYPCEACKEEMVFFAIGKAIKYSIDSDSKTLEGWMHASFHNQPRGDQL